MLRIIGSRKPKYYRSLLEGFGEQSDPESFYSDNFKDMYTFSKPNEFGYIIVERRLTGFYEIITGTKIPVINYKRTADNETILITPKSAYRIRKLVPVDDVIIENYRTINDNQEFRDNLESFIEKSNKKDEECKKLFRRK